MKKNIKKLLTLLSIVFSLSACNFSGSSSIAPSSLDSISSIDNTSSDIAFDETTRREHDKWDELTYQMIEYSVGDVAKKVPALVTTSYVTYFERITSENLSGEVESILTTRVLCGGIDALMYENYGKTLEKNGFVYSLDYDCYYAKANSTDCLYVYMTYFKATERLNLQIYRKTIRYNEWDNDIAFLVAGRDIPHIDCGSYEYYFDSYTLSLYIYFVDITEKQITDYKTALTMDGWKRTSTSNVDDIYNHSKDNDLKITLEAGLDAFGDSYLMVHLENDWPFFLIYSSLGTDLPKCSFADYYGYDTNESSSGDYYTQIEYDNCTQEAYTNYCNELTSMKYGFSTYEVQGQDNPGSYISSEQGYGTVYYAYYAKKLENNEFAYVDVLYSSGLQRLIIIIWA